MNETIQAAPETTPEAVSPDTKSVGSIRWTHIAVWGVALLILGVLGWGLLNSTAPRPEAGQPAPDFTMEFFDGYEWQTREVASLEELRGQVVVLNFWASWCVECRVEADLLEQTWRKYADQGVVFVGIAYADVEPKSIAYMEEFDITYPNAPDLRTSISADYEITGVPETFFIDKNGEIAEVVIGPVRAETMERTIAQLLAEEEG